MRDLPTTAFSRAIDGMLDRLGRLASWLWVVLLFIIVLNVLMRYVFGEGRVEFEELQWHINSIAFLVAIAYAYKTDSHIRIDLISNRLHRRTQAWIELYGIVLLLIPFIVLVLIVSLPFVEHSWSVSEISQSPGGLPFRWLLKGFVPAAFALLLLGVLARLSRVWAFITTDTARSMATMNEDDAA